MANNGRTLTNGVIEMKESKKPIRCDLPQYVHDYLASLHGTKKYNAEAILMSAARKNGFKE